MLKEPGQESFETYNNAGANPGKTHDGKPVPAWHDLGENVRAKWAAAEKRAGVVRLEAFGDRPYYPGHALVIAFGLALGRYAKECYAHNAPLSLRILLECFEDELKKLRFAASPK